MATSKRRHPVNALTALQVRNVKVAGRYADGNGLYLVVDDSGARRWLLRTVVRGRRRDIGLGSAMLVPLADAREQARVLRKVAREGGDPLMERDKRSHTAPTFKVAAETVHGDHKSTWRNPKHGAQWINTLTKYAFPTIGDKRVDEIDTPDILQVLTPIWTTKAETARRVRQRLKVVFDWAKAAGHRSGDNPVDGVTSGLPKQTESVKHHAALPYTDVPAFVQALRASNSGVIVKDAFEFLILTAARTGEVLGARWDEVDMEAKLWVVPAERMKAKREHRVPLSVRCLAILEGAKAYRSTSPYLFHGRSEAKPLSGMTFTKVMRTMKAPATPHGFRSSFRDWVSEATTHPRDVAEMALAHTIGNKVEAAYRRGDLFEKRRALMQDWQAFIAGDLQ